MNGIYLYFVNKPFPVGRYWDFKIESIEGEAKNNQSVENAGVAFVKGAIERNEFFEKKIYNKQSKGLRNSGTN